MIGALQPQYKIRMNYPYLGTSNGMTAYFRKQYPKDRYICFELEINQRLFYGDNGMSYKLHPSGEIDMTDIKIISNKLLEDVLVRSLGMIINNSDEIETRV